MKLYRMVHKNLSYHIEQSLLPEVNNTYFLFASEIYHDSILLKIEKKDGKYLF